MKSRLVRIGWVATILFTCVFLVAAHADTPKKPRSRAKAKESPPPAVVEEPASTWPAAELTLGFQVRDSETEGIGDLLIPIWNPGGNGLLFLNPRSAFTDHSAEEYNIGIGYRQLFPKFNFILGANAYYDYRDTAAGHYDQWGAGLEFLSTWVDARVNYYDPEDKQLVVARETETSTRQYTRSSSTWLDPYAENHAVMQDFRVTQTLVTETFTRTFEQYQQPLGGYDWEIGLRLPIQAKNIEARLFGGYYDFDRDFGNDVKGWKARAEVRLNSTFFLDAGIYENDELTGSDWFAGARVALPLDFAALSKGRNPFAGAKSRWSGEGREFSARLTEMVMRDPQIRLETSKMLENKALASENIAKQSASQQGAFVLLPDVQFVDGDAPFSGDGSAEFPLTTIQAGANTVFGSRNVYVFNASGPYNENVVLQPGTTLWGSGSLIQGMGGKTFGSGIAPIVDGRSMGPSITMANNTTVRGMHVRNTDMGGPDQMVIFPGLPTFEISRVGIFGPDVTGLTIRDNLIAGNLDGVVLGRLGDFDLLFANNRANHNESVGLWIEGVGASGTFNVLIENSQFNNNTFHGLALNAFNYDFSLVSLRNSTFSRNGDNGAYINQANTFLAMVLADGGQASGNGSDGLHVEQIGNLISLANLSGLSANNNGQYGIRLFQDSDLISVGLIGLPDGFGDLVGGLADMIGLGLPPELAAFFEPSGGVTASGNNWGGISTEQYTLNGLTLGGFFDITANNNAGDGVNAFIASDTGVAIGLAGSSQNLAEILQLGSDALGFLGLDVPLSLPGGGQMQANNNSGNGLTMQVDGGFGAIAALVGMEASGNLGVGVDISTEADVFAIAAAARVNAIGNEGGGGLGIGANADSFALGLIADVNASDNVGPGILANVFSDNGAAILLTLSTDALRPLASSLLGYDLPGQPWGPVTANNNWGPGVMASVGGEYLALAAFLDTQANHNSSGFVVDVQSSSGTALAAFLSSDLLYDFIPGLLGGDPIPGAGLGGITASQNLGGNGINLNVSGFNMAAALLAGVEANENWGGGINATINSADGGAYGILVDIDATRNVVGNGITLDLQSDWDALIGMVVVDADWNGGRGVQINANSANANAYALLSDVDPWHNSGAGLYANLTAANDVALAITDSSSRWNTGRGANVLLNAGADAYFFAGDLAADDLDAVFNYSGMIGPLVGLIPTGPVAFSDNGLGGLHLDATSTAGDVFLGINGANAHNNSNMGFNLNLRAVNGDIFAEILDARAVNNGGHGLTLDLMGGGGSANVTLSRVVATDNGNNGINILDNYTGGAFVIGERLTAINNDANGVRIFSDGVGALALDFGGGGDSAGLSSFFGNGIRDFRYNNGTPITVMAENNWWGANANPVPGQTVGLIDATPWLTSAP